ncbi:MAG: homocysteine S-methyltransferase family protein, partial [Ilumatobacteraceae bacterium]
MTFTVVDGGLSTALESLGHHPAGLLWTAQLVIEQPEVVVAAHRLFVDAGAEVIITSSYQASVAGFENAGVSRSEAVRALASTTELARRSGAATVAASVGPYGATLGDGSEYHGRYDASWDDVRAFHHDRIAVLVDSGPDLMAVETIPGLIEAEIVLDELQRAGAPMAWLTMSCVDGVHTCAGDVFADVVAALAPGVFAVGVNCTAPPLV